MVGHACRIATAWAESLPVLKLENDISPAGVTLNRVDLEGAAPYLEHIAESSPEGTPPLEFFENIFGHYKKRLMEMPNVIYNVDIASQAVILKASKHVVE